MKTVKSQLLPLSGLTSRDADCVLLKYTYKYLYLNILIYYDVTRAKINIVISFLINSWERAVFLM